MYFSLLDINISFVNNKAQDGGDAIYGEKLHDCLATQFSEREFISGAYVFAQNWSNVVTYSQVSPRLHLTPQEHACVWMESQIALLFLKQRPTIPGKHSISL